MNTDYKKKIKVCELLGAKKFQQCVFMLEKYKWKVVKKICPNYLKYADKIIDKKVKKKLKKSENSDDSKNIKLQAAQEKMLIRKAYNSNHLINYHINNNDVTSFLYHLSNNKKIHKNGLVLNLVLYPALIAATSLGATLAIPLLAYNTVSTFINFECINIQNYNTYRIKSVEDKLKKHEEKKMNRCLNNYGEAIDLISNTITKKEDIPSFDEILANIKTKEQAQQMRKFLLEMKNKTNNEQKKKGMIKHA